MIVYLGFGKPMMDRSGLHAGEHLPSACQWMIPNLRDPYAVH